MVCRLHDMRRNFDRTVALQTAGTRALLRAVAIIVGFVLEPTAVPAANEPAHAGGTIDTGPSNPIASVSLETLNATRDRPLFSPGRRPPPAPPAPVVQMPAPPPPPPPPSVALIGVVMDGEKAVALVRLGSADKVLRAEIGDDIDGWKVAQIEGHRLVVTLDDRSATFRLFNREGTRQSSPVAAPSRQASSQAEPLPQPTSAKRKHR